MGINQDGVISKILLIIFVVLIIAGGIFYFSRSKSSNNNQPIAVSTTNPSPSINPETSLLIDAAVWYPSAPWSQPASTTEQTVYGNLTGESIQATVTSSTASIPHFEIVDQLKKNGFSVDNNLAADGPGSSVWGYKKDSNGQSQVMIFSYKTEPTSSNPNEPLQFDCPCKVDINVFVSNPFTPQPTTKSI